MRENMKKYGKKIFTWLFKVMKIIGSVITSLCKQIYKYHEEETKALALQNKARIQEQISVNCANEIRDFLSFEADLLHRFGVDRDAANVMRYVLQDNGFLVISLPKENIHTRIETPLLRRLTSELNCRIPHFREVITNRIGSVSFQSCYPFIFHGIFFIAIQDNLIEVVIKVKVHGD